MRKGTEQCLNSAKDLLVHILSIEPNDPITLYNLACAESLLGNIEEALSKLKSAIVAGYHNMSHMIDDSDFENIKFTDGFLECINLIAEKQNNPEPTESISELTESQPLSELKVSSDPSTSFVKLEQLKEPTQPQESEEYSMIKNLLLEMGIMVDEQRLREICTRYQNDISEIVNNYLF